MITPTPPLHGGRLHAATEQYNIPLTEWLDLSTGINPVPWMPMDIPLWVWQRLPDSYDALRRAARAYYGVGMIPVPGSQWAIQTLPTLFSTRRIWIPEQGYEEHAYWWQAQHHDARFYTALPTEFQPNDALLVINPNNPTGHIIPPQQLLALAHQLNALNGILVVDEAFIDATPEYSVLTNDTRLPPNLIVLRSFGKFFGLAGLRLGFVRCDTTIADRMQQQLGPWAISNPAAYLGEQALLDSNWQHATRHHLQRASTDLAEVLRRHFEPAVIQQTRLFCTLELGPTPAAALFQHCAQQGILLRLFENWGKVRVGLTTQSGLERLQSALQCWDS